MTGTQQSAPKDLTERLRLAALAENTLYGANAGSLYDDAADQLEFMRSVIFKAPKVHDTDCKLGPNDPDARCSCWVSEARSVLGC